MTFHMTFHDISHDVSVAAASGDLRLPLSLCWQLGPSAQTSSFPPPLDPESYLACPPPSHKTTPPPPLPPLQPCWAQGCLGCPTPLSAWAGLGASPSCSSPSQSRGTHSGGYLHALLLPIFWHSLCGCHALPQLPLVLLPLLLLILQPPVAADVCHPLFATAAAHCYSLLPDC